MKKTIIAVWILSALLLAACGGAGRANEGPQAAEGPCPQPGKGEHAYRDEALGICFSYPEGYNVAPEGENGLLVFAGEQPQPLTPKASIQIEPAEGRTAEGLAGEILAGVQEVEGIERVYGLMIGGETQVSVIDHLPGEELYRLVLVVHGDRLYRLKFTPSDHNLGPLFDEVERLYASLSNSFTFLP